MACQLSKAKLIIKPPFIIKEVEQILFLLHTHCLPHTHTHTHAHKHTHTRTHTHAHTHNNTHKHTHTEREEARSGGKECRTRGGEEPTQKTMQQQHRHKRTRSNTT